MGSNWMLVAITRRGTVHMKVCADEAEARESLERERSTRQFATTDSLYEHLYIGPVCMEVRQ